jgi:hypothetical protein
MRSATVRACRDPAAEWAERDQDLGAAREALGEKRFARAWEFGRALSADQAVHEARTAGPPPGPSSSPE